MKKSNHGTLWKALRQSLIFTNDQLVPFLLCCLGTITEVADLLGIYFAFPTITAIQLYSPDYITLPAVTICYQFDLDVDTIRQKIPRFNNLNDGIQHKFVRYNLTLEELDEITAQPEDLITNCWVANSTSSYAYVDYVDCFKVAPIQVYLDSRRKCFTFFYGPESPFIYPKIIFADEFFLTLYVNINISSRPYFQMIIHENDQEVSSNHGSPEMVLMDSRRFNDFVVTYYTEQMVGLGPPYSNCKDYFGLYNRTRIDLVKKCIFESIYRDYRALNDEILVHLPFNHSDANFLRGIRAGRYRSGCEILYDQPECETKSFQLILLRSLRMNSNNNQPSGTSLIQFGYPIGKQINVTSMPKQDPLEYFCYVASMVNLWLEISVLGVVSFIFKNFRLIVIKLFKKYCHRKVD